MVNNRKRSSRRGVLGGVGGGGGGGGGVSVESITLPATASVTMNATVTLMPVITPADADKSLIWTSNDNNIASVAEGVVTGKSPGTVTITAVSKSNSSKSVACAVAVSAVPVPLTALGVSPASASLLVNGELSLNAVFTPENTTDRAVTWTSSDETVATVDANGLVKAKTAAGQATVTVKSASDPTKTAACVITVTATAKPLEGLTVVPAVLPLQVGGARQLEVNVSPADATDRRVTFESSDAAKASVSATGAVTALAAGTAVITVTSVSDPAKTARCEVTLTDILVTRITVTSPVAPAAVLEDKTLHLGVVVEPSNAANKGVTWSSSDPDKAAVDPNTGIVTGKLKGLVTITAASKDGSNISNTLNLTVTPRVRTIAVNPSNPSVRIGTAVVTRLTATVSPSDAAQAVTWTSSDPTKASIDASGTVTPIAPGTITITAVASDGSGTVGTALLTVLGSNDASVSAIALGDENFPLPVPSAGGTTTLNNAPRTVASDITAVKVNITAAANATIKIGTNAFVSGGTANFSAPVTFTVTAQDGTTVRTYTVSITAYHADTNPYGIYTVAHLNDVRNNKAGSYKMINNIVLPARNEAGAVATSISDYADKGWLPIAHDAGGTFTGKFDGGNFSVDNFYINRNAAGDYYTGLFGRTSGAVISNTGITGSASPAVTGSRYVGALAGLVNGGSVTNCYAHVAVRLESNVANLLGSCAGGLIGYMAYGSLSASYSSGNVSGNLSASGNLNIGGLAGALGQTANISNCFAAGNIVARSSFAVYGGGLAGVLYASTANCYAAGNVACTARSAQDNNIGALRAIIGNAA